jgi:hypothetical protein
MLSDLVEDSGCVVWVIYVAIGTSRHPILMFFGTLAPEMEETKTTNRSGRWRLEFSSFGPQAGGWEPGGGVLARRTAKVEGGTLAKPPRREEGGSSRSGKGDYMHSTSDLETGRYFLMVLMEGLFFAPRRLYEPPMHPTRPNSPFHFPSSALLKGFSPTNGWAGGCRLCGEDRLSRRKGYSSNSSS